MQDADKQFCSVQCKDASMQQAECTAPKRKREADEPSEAPAAEAKPILRPTKRSKKR